MLFIIVKETLSVARFQSSVGGSDEMETVSKHLTDEGSSVLVQEKNDKKMKSERKKLLSMIKKYLRAVAQILYYYVDNYVTLVKEQFQV